jgi:hypothetical protein
MSVDRRFGPRASVKSLYGAVFSCVAPNVLSFRHGMESNVVAAPEDLRFLLVMTRLDDRFVFENSAAE